MTSEPPTLAQQIAAVEQALKMTTEACRELHERGVGGFVERWAADYHAALTAARDTLKTLEFTREVA